MLFLKYKISFSDIFSNSLAYLLFGVAGLSINLYLFFFGSFEAVGVFNQFYVFFVIFGQLFSFSIPEFNLRYLPIQSSKEKLKNLISIATIVSFFSGFLAFTFIIFLRDLIFKFNNSENIYKGLITLGVAVIFFVLNKNFLSILNSLKKFKQFAFINSFRSLSLIFFSIIFLDNNDYSKLSLIFLITELFVLIICLFLISKYFIFYFYEIKNNFKLILNFFKKTIIYSFLSETFIRIDILMISYFFNDKYVGIYALAAIFSEGIYQISVYVRNLVYPNLSEFSKSKIYNNNFFIKFSTYSFFLTFLFSVLTLLSFYLFNIFYNEIHNDISDIFIILFILLVGISMYSVFSPFEMIFVLSGFPITQSLIIFFVSFINIIMNYFFINYYGLIGAAFSTTLVLFIYGNLTYYISSKLLNLKYGYFLTSKQNSL